MDLLKLLKSKQVAIEAKQTLKMLHGRCFGLKQVLGFLNQALGRGKSAGGKKGNAPVKGKAAGNTAVTEIVEWVADSVEDERHGHGTCISDKSTIENVAGLFMSCVENRDVKCRRAAQEVRGLEERSDELGLRYSRSPSEVRMCRQTLRCSASRCHHSAPRLECDIRGLNSAMLLVSVGRRFHR